MSGKPLPDDEYLRQDACGLAELVRTRAVSPRELVETAISRIERLNPLVNAVIHRMDESAQRAALGPLPEGPFRGVPLLLKDLLASIAGEPFECGSGLLRGFRAPHDSELVRRYRRAGFVILGKTNTPEFGLTPVTEPAACGPTHNPWDLSRTSGGSSGGSAAAVASGMVPVAGGGDGGGSIRIPASCCGLFGLKPTRGRTPMGPDVGELWHGAVVEHVLTRSVRDSAVILDATAGPDAGAPYFAAPPERPYREELQREPGRLRIAFTARPWLGGVVHPDCSAALLDAARLLETLGHEVEEASPVIDGPAFAEAFLTMICGELGEDLAEAERAVGRKATPKDLEHATWALGLLGRTLPAVRVTHAVRLLQRSARQIAPFFARFDVLVTPTLSAPPVKTGALQPTPRERFLLELLGGLRSGRLLRWAKILEQTAAKVFDFIPWTPVSNITGQPAMSVPLCWNAEGLPIGVHCIGRFGDEATLFRLAAQLEQARPWFDRLPAISYQRSAIG
ncbi:MAG TPA: amidase [Gemmatimonadales bacterium]|nr:amidase [Gemmatimonadales bacterium]